MIASREYIIKRLAELIIEPKKKYSQNFITDYEVVKMMIDSLNLLPNDEVIEIGPGLGALTEEVALRGNTITAYEIDEDMVRHLNEYFARRNNVKIVFGDFLKQDLSSFQDKRVAVVSNVPYNVTTPILERILKAKLNISVFTFMIQKEVASRVKAKINTKEYSPLSIMMDYLGKIEVVTKVTKDKYIPAPNVDSIVLKLTFNKERDYEKETALYKLLNASFSMRRKTILNNLNAYFNSKDKALAVLEKANLSPTLRAEQISLDEYLKMVEVILCK